MAGLNPRCKTLLVYLLIAVLALVFIGGSWLWWPGFDTAPLMDWIKSVGLWAIPVLMLLMVAHNFVPIPAEVIALCAGAILGTLTGTLVIWAGAMLGAVLAFWLARRFGRGLIERHANLSHLDRFDALMQRQGTAGLLFARLTPLVAFNLVNYGAGLTKISWATFLWTTAIGILPITVLTAYAGANMADLSTGAILILTAIGLIGFALVGWLRRDRS